MLDQIQDFARILEPLAHPEAFSYLIYSYELELIKKGEPGASEKDFLKKLRPGKPCLCFYSFQKFVIAFDWNSTVNIGRLFYKEKLGNVLYGRVVKKKSKIELDKLYDRVVTKHPELQPSRKSARAY